MIIFTHICRTAGASFVNVLRGSGKWKIQKMHAMSTLSPDVLKDDTQLIAGHIPYGVHNDLKISNPEYITFVREPVSRWISSFRHGIQNNKTGVYELWNNDPKTFIEQCIRQGRNVNTMTRQMSGMESYDNVNYDGFAKDYMYYWAGRKDTYTDSVMTEFLEKAKENIQKYVFVGFQEGADFWFGEFRAKYNLANKKYRRRHRSRVSVSFSDSETDMIAEANRYDLELYKYVLEIRGKEL